MTGAMRVKPSADVPFGKSNRPPARQPLHMGAQTMQDRKKVCLQADKNP